MITELDNSNFHKLIPLFPDVFYNLGSLAVLNKDINGHVWVDDPENPKSCMIVDNEWTIHLGGNHDNNEFNQHIEQIIREDIFPKAKRN